MGRDKAFLPFPAPDGPPLIARQAALLRRLGITDLIISGRPGIAYTPTVPDARVVFDATPDSGPLAGLAAILAAARHPWVLVIAVDLPHLTSTYLRTLLAASGQRNGVVPCGPSGYEPLVALYPRSLLATIHYALIAGQLSLQDLLRKATAASLFKTVDISDADLPLFANCNTPRELDSRPARASS